jgi:hypothetical protein
METTTVSLQHLIALSSSPVPSPTFLFPFRFLFAPPLLIIPQVCLASRFVCLSPNELSWVELPRGAQCGQLPQREHPHEGTANGVNHGHAVEAACAERLSARCRTACIGTGI